MDAVLLGLSLVVVLSIFARLIGSLVGIPAILPLLLAGVLAGTSVTGLIDPTELLGDSLSPLVQIAVGIILFEGALGLRREELAAGVRPAVTRLLTLGVLLTWLLGSLAVEVLFDLPLEISVLIGAVLIVSGPTVVIPILDFVAPTARVRAVLKWEGIIVDPVGAIIAVVVFGSIVGTGGRIRFDAIEILSSVGAGVLVGAVVAMLLMPILGSRRLAGRDKVAATLMMVVVAFGLADALFTDSGLMATIVMGVVLANQRRVKIDYIVEFKETLVPLLIGILFVLLAANVDIGAVIDLGWKGLALVAFLVLVVRPVAVATTLGLPFSWRERAFFAGMSPRGIVAASTASAFGLELTTQGVDGAEMIIPITFLVIAGTVLIAGLSLPPLAYVLGLAGNRPPSLLLVGAPRWGLALGRALTEAGARVSVWTENEAEATAAEEAGLSSFGGPLDPQNRSVNSIFEDLSAIALVSDDDTLNQVLSWNLAEKMEPDQVFRLRSPFDAAPIVPTAATPLFANLQGEAEIERRLGAGESMFVIAAGEPVPAQAIAIASIRESKGSMRPTIKLASDRGLDFMDSQSKTIALGPSGSV